MAAAAASGIDGDGGVAAVGRAVAALAATVEATAAAVARLTVKAFAALLRHPCVRSDGGNAVRRAA